MAKQDINYTGNKLEADCKLYRLRFYNGDNNFGIADFVIVKDTGRMQPGRLITCKGRMNKPLADVVYTIKGDELDDPKWGLQYNVTSMYTPVNMALTENVDNFMRQVLSEGELLEAHKVFENPFEAFDRGDITELTKIKGIGLKKAVAKLERFNKAKAFLKVFAELAEFNLTESMLGKLKNAYGDNPDLIVQVVKENPYVMAQDVYGIGFKTCDKIALDGGMNPNSPKRVAAYIRQYLSECTANGLSWITSDHLLGGILDNLGEDIPDESITEAIHNMDKELWYSEDHTKIGLKRSYDMEYKIAEELHRLATAESHVRNDNWMDAVKRIERLNGWEFTDEQKQAIEMGNNNNVFVLTGYAGTGKSHTVKAILEANKGVRLLQCALSGRASSKLFEITGQEGITIHRALSYPLGEEKYGGFAYNQDNKLEVDIVIVDEVSMIGGNLFYSLIRAIPDGAKLVLLGDIGQLPAIGNGNVLNDIIASDEIPAINLTKIHRQAQRSAIITESLKVRQGEQLISKDWVGKEVRGELQDLSIECFSDKSNTFYQAVEQFNREMTKPDFDIMECQLIVPIKTRGDACTNKLNMTLQDIYNPEKTGEKVCKVFRDGRTTVFRKGDKVINTKNNYTTKDINDKICPIYNGSIGIITDIDKYGSLTVDFSHIGKVFLDRYSDKGDERLGLELAYAITTHKSQGDQYGTVIFAFDYTSYTLLSKEMVYTAMTRAKKMCYIICQNSALRYATATNSISQKQTFLQDCLKDVFHPKLVF